MALSQCWAGILLPAEELIAKRIRNGICEGCVDEFASSMAHSYVKNWYLAESNESLCACLCVRACVRVYVRASARVCVCVSVCLYAQCVHVRLLVFAREHTFFQYL